MRPTGRNLSGLCLALASWWMRTAQSDLAVKLLSECDSKGQRDNTTHPHRSTLDPLVCGVGGSKRGCELWGSRQPVEIDIRDGITTQSIPQLSPGGGNLSGRCTDRKCLFVTVFISCELFVPLVCSFYRALAEKCHLYQPFQVCTTDRYTLIW